jgi:hypothetical protein
MKFEKKGIAIIIVAVLILTVYLLHPYVIEGNRNASPEQKITTINNQLNLDKYKNPTDPVVIGQKLNLKKQLRDLVAGILANTNIKIKPQVKARYEKIKTDSDAEIVVLQKQLSDAQAARKASRK